MKLRYILYLFLTMVVLSCKTSQKIVEKTTTSNQTLKEHIVSFKDTTFIVPKLTTNLKVPIAEILKAQKQLSKDSTTSKPVVFQLQNGRSKVKIKVARDTLTATSDCDSIALRAQIKTELIKELSTKKTDTVKQSHKVTGYNFFDVAKCVLIALVLGFVAGYFTRQLKRIKSRIL